MIVYFAILKDPREKCALSLGSESLLLTIVEVEMNVSYYGLPADINFALFSISSFYLSRANFTLLVCFEIHIKRKICILHA